MPAPTRSNLTSRLQAGGAFCPVTVALDSQWLPLSSSWSSALTNGPSGPKDLGSLQPQLVCAAWLTLCRSHAGHLTAPHAGRRPRLPSSLVSAAKPAWPWAVPHAQWLRRSFTSLPAALKDPSEIPGHKRPSTNASSHLLSALSPFSPACRYSGPHNP